jgi:hypothetical protein
MADVLLSLIPKYPEDKLLKRDVEIATSIISNIQNNERASL